MKNTVTPSGLGGIGMQGKDNKGIGGATNTVTPGIMQGDKLGGKGIGPKPEDPMKNSVGQGMGGIQGKDMKGLGGQGMGGIGGQGMGKDMKPGGQFGIGGDNSNKPGGQFGIGGDNKPGGQGKR
jgi:hypothetical protein